MLSRASATRTPAQSTCRSPPPTASRTFNVQTLDDSIVGNTTLTVTLSFQPGGANGDSIGATPVATVTILDNDGPPVFSFSQANYNVNENAGHVTIGGQSSGAAQYAAVNVKYDTIDGTATAPADYIGIAPTHVELQRSAQTVATFTVFIVNDAAPSSEKFSCSFRTSISGTSAA